MSVSEDQLGEERKWPLGPDIVEECQAVSNMEPVDEDRWTPLFEPTDFNNQHQPLEIENYKLSEADLKTWADRCTALRATIR